jgi:hypothetical protein
MRSRLVVPLALFGAALLALGFRARSLASRSVSMEWQLAIERADGCVRTVAERGMGAWQAAVCRGMGARPLAPLLGAWGRLSVGRAGHLPLALAERWPWLLLAALAPLAVFALVSRVHGQRLGALAAAWLLLLPGYTLGVAGIAADVLLGPCWLLALAPYAVWLGARERAARRRALALVALGCGAAVAFALRAAWVLPLMIAHYAFSHAALVTRLARRGRAPLPSATLAALLASAAACVAFDPALWHSDPPQAMVVLFAEPLAGSSAHPAPGMALWIWLLGGLGLLGLAWRALGRRFASGELRPARDPSGTGALIACGLVGAYALGGTEAALPFLAIAAALGASTLSQLAVRERWRLPLQVLLLVLAAIS